MSEEAALGVVVAAGVAAPEGPTKGPRSWILNVCSFTRNDQGPTFAGDVVATLPGTLSSTVRVLNTSFNGVVGIPAALAFGPDGALYITDEGHRAVLRATPDGALDVFVESPNGPNDLSFDSNGDLWFTDPWQTGLENPVGSVYVYRWPTQRLEQVAAGLAFPNGIVATDHSIVYAETRTRLLWRHERLESGSIGPSEVFAELPRVPGVEDQGPDGMALDVDGNLYVANYGAGCVWVLDPSGLVISRIRVPGQNPTNVCFGGHENRTLFITIDDTDELISVSTDVVGADLNFCPSVVEPTAHAWARALDKAEPVV